MAPTDFRLARESGEERVLVDGKPYLPQLKILVEGSKNPLENDRIAPALTRMIVQLFQLSNLTPETSISSSLQVTPISGGITNTLYKITGLHAAFPHHLSQIPADDALLVRLFGAEGMIDRDVENATFAALANADIAPTYYGAFANGRCEGWLDNMQTPSCRDMVQWIPQIAHAAAVLHYSFTLPPSLQEYHSGAGLWKQLEEWYAQALSSTFQNDHDTERARKLNLPQFRRELDWLRSDIIPPQAAVGFCHNDLLCANIMHDTTTRTTVRFIDFEYGGCNYKSFDIANHWNEYAGGPPHSPQTNYDWFPSVSQQRAFVQAYLDKAKEIIVETNQTHLDNGNDEHATTRTRLPSVDELVQEIQGFVMVNHLYWGLWAVNQAANEGCDEFDYMMYAINRLEQYWVCRKDHDSDIEQSENPTSEHKLEG